MQKRILGKNLEVSALGLGCMSMSAASGLKLEGARIAEAALKMTGR